MKELWKVMEDSFKKKTRKNSYDRFVFFSSEQQKGESVESFYDRFIQQAEKCSLQLNFLDFEIKKKLLKETLSPTKAYEITINSKIGAHFFLKKSKKV